MAKRMSLAEVEVINTEVMHPAEGTRVELKGKVGFTVDLSRLDLPPEPDVLSEEELRADIEQAPLKIVAATVGEDEHSVGLREIIDIKHGGIEQYGIECHYLGTSVPIEKLLDAAIELDARAVLASTIISHDDIHYANMGRLHQLAVEKGVRDRLIIVCGGTQVTPELARETGVDAGFGRGTKGIQVASFLVRRRRELTSEVNGRVNGTS
jgi:D-ornithine 4,5-aminomutase subunit beta